MPKKFSILSWNVKMFSLKTTLKDRVVDLIRRKDPDIFAILEVKGKDVWRYMYREFPTHCFFITEGPQTQEILVAFRRNLDCFITQRDEFKSGRTTLRPGPFLTLKQDNDYYGIVFVHLKSMDDPEGFGLRDDMITHAFHLKTQLDKLPESQGNAKFIVLGDFNTMGMKYPYDQEVEPEIEIKRLKNRTRYYQMTLLSKDYSATWTNKAGDVSNLDHVLASKAINFKTWNGNQVQVIGWQQHQQGTPEHTEFITKVSDHCAIYLEVI